VRNPGLWVVMALLVILAMATYVAMDHAATNTMAVVQKVEWQIARNKSGKPMGHFEASWSSGGIEITVEANQNEGETADQFASRCRGLVDAMKAQFPPD
jgi:hypothetical protein